MEESKKVPIIFTRDQIESMDNFIKENEGYSRSSFVREAVEYYLGYIDMNENVNYISPLINQNIKLILSRFEDRMSEMIFISSLHTKVSCQIKLWTTSTALPNGSLPSITARLIWKILKNIWMNTMCSVM